MRFVTTIAYAGLFTLITTVSALAHAEYQSSVPETDATVKSAPKEISIVFSEEVNPDLSRIVVNDSAGTEVDMGNSHIVGGNAKQLAVDVKSLQAGTYMVLWISVAADDGHKLTGKFKFTIAP